MSRPRPDAAFRWSREVWGDALRCIPLESRAQHLFTTRQLQLHTSDPARVWALVAESAGASVDRLIRIKQVHGRSVRIVRREDGTATGTAARPHADAIVANVAGAVLAVETADCVPILIAAPRAGAAAAVHAGWRGTAVGVAAATVASLVRECGARPDDLHVAVGPSIGACCYEVGVELVDAFRAAGVAEGEIQRWFSSLDDSDPPRALRLDLWRANHDQLVAAGVLPGHIYMSRLCTQTHADIFDSYRAAGAGAGRMIAAIKVPHV